MLCIKCNYLWQCKAIQQCASSCGLSQSYPLDALLALQVAPVIESVDKEWNRVSLTVAQDGTITSHTGKLALFGLEKEVL